MSANEDLVRKAFDLTREGRAEEARATMEQAAAAGSSQAAVFAATWRLIGYAGGVEPTVAVEFLKTASDNGEALGLTMLGGLAATDLLGPRDWSQALEYLVAAAKLGETRAQSQLVLLLPEDAPERDALARREPVDWAAAVSRVQWPHERGIPPATRLRESPQVEVIRGLLTADECTYVMARGAPYLQRAQVGGVDGAPMLTQIRTNDAMVFAYVETDVVIQSIDSLVARVLACPAENGEQFALLRYRPGQAYAPHCDWIDPATPGKDREVAESGQRIATLLVYLNDEFRGGETHFVRLNWSFKGRRGDALLWRNVKPDGSIDPMTLHAGLAPTAGEKWLLSKWMRDKPQVTTCSVST